MMTTGKISHLDAVVLHDDYGTIRHLCYFGTAEGAAHPDRRDREQMAKELAQKMDSESHHLSVLHIAGERLVHGRRYRINMRSMDITESE